MADFALFMIFILEITVLESVQVLEEVQAVIRQLLPRSGQVFAGHMDAIVADMIHGKRGYHERKE